MVNMKKQQRRCHLTWARENRRAKILTFKHEREERRDGEEGHLEGERHNEHNLQRQKFQ